MSAEFRQRRPSEYLEILRRRKWLLILPVIAITTAVGYVVYRLPSVYESSTLIVVKASNLPAGVIPTVTEDSLTRQLSSISQVVTSRSSLEPLVEKYELYKTERLRGEAMENIFEKLRGDITVKVNTSSNITNGFNIYFRYRDPAITQAVTAELATKYINVQANENLNARISGKAFIDNQVDQAKEALSEVDKRRVEFMSQNVGKLPSEATGLFNQLAGLREEQKALIGEVGRLQDRRTSIANQMVLLKENRAQQIDEISENLPDPKTTQAWSTLVSRKAQLEGDYTRITQELKPKHPDVMAKKKEIEQVQVEMDSMIAEWKGKIEEKRKKMTGRTDVGAGAMENDLRFVDNEIKRQQKLLADNEKQIGSIVDRINNVPGVEVALGAIEREYQTQKTTLDQLLEQQQRLNLGKEAASQQQGEGIQVIDAAYLPSDPVAPKRLFLSGIGLVAGLGFGLLLVALFEGPRLLTIQNTEDARHYTGLPVLLAVPELLTPQEARAIPRRRRLLLAAGMVIAIVSIPVLALALKFTHVFEILGRS